MTLDVGSGSLRVSTDAIDQLIYRILKFDLRSHIKIDLATIATVARSRPLDELSNRELQIYRLVGHGMSTKDIARQLYLSAKTVESHRAHIKQKLGLETTTALVAHAAEWLFRGSHLVDGNDGPAARVRAK